MKLKSIVQAIALLGVATPLMAQSDAAASQRVEITGSSIKRIAAEGALPVQVISRVEMEKQGIVTAEQLIATLSGNGNSLDNLASNADVVAGASRGNNGASSANLRGQGASSTLVLLNGRRIASHGLNGGAVDLNSIPMAAVDRVEVLKDGASAIYGTDAIGGVINFILRKDYQGLEAQAFLDKTQHGGGDIARVKVAAGFGNLERDKYNLLLTLGRSENKALRGDQRDFVNTFQADRGLSVDTRGTPYATVFAISSLYNALSRDNINTTGRGTGPIQPGTTVAMNGINALDLPGGAGCNSIDGQQAYDEVLWATPAAKWGCAWDTGRAAVLQQPVTNTNLVAKGTLAVGEHQITAEITAAKVESMKSFSAQQLSASTNSANPLYNLSYPASGAAYNSVFNQLVKTFPTLEANRGQPLALRWRCMPCGPREIETTADTQRMLLAAEGPLFAGWDYKAGLSQATSDVTSLLGSGYFYGKPFAALINTGVLNPFSADGITQTAEAMNALAATSAKGVTLYGGKTTMQQTDFTASGPLFKLPAGTVMAAVGLDMRTEKYKFNGSATDLALQTTIFNAPFDNVNTLDTVKRDIKAEFAELLVPVMKGLELTLAARHDNYTGFGGTTNPKASLRFEASKNVMLRGSYSTGFRVPTFNQLYNGLTESTYAGKDLVDPKLCPSGKVDSTNANCAAITPVIYTGGKPNLGPEESKQWTAGFVVDAGNGASVSVDWWSIRKSGTIQSLSLSDMVNNYGLFADRFIRNEAGAVVILDDRWINAGETVTKGVDINARINGKLGEGRWSAILDGSYLLDKRSRLISSAAMGASEIGVFTRAGDLGLRWKHSLIGSYSQGDWSFTGVQRYSTGYKDAQLPGVANGSIVPANWQPNVGHYEIYDASVRYTGIKNLGLTFGIKNLFDKEPPFSAAYDGNTGAGSSWEPRVADPRLRSFTFTLDYKFF